VIVEINEPESRHEIAVTGRDPLGELPTLVRGQVDLERRLARVGLDGAPPAELTDLEELAGCERSLGPVEVLWRASGLRRPSLVAQMAWPRLSTRLALGIETPVAHAIVDRLLGSERVDTELRLQLSPVEWGILTFLLARRLSRLADRTGPLGPWDLTLDRVGPDPFDARGLGPIVTLRWPTRVGNVSGSVRLWLPESLVARWGEAEPPPLPDADPALITRLGDLSGVWRAEAGAIDMPRGLAKLRPGMVLPPGGIRLAGTPKDPRGAIDLILDTGRDGRFRCPAEPVPSSGGGRLTVTALAQRTPSPREALAVKNTPDPDASVAANDVPVTLVVELGRVNLSLRRLADLKPGDVVELGRHSREPVELTSGGRLVARGELVQIDNELGVRVLSVFL
jgi:type III secretion system YscQ/HrcQ family protein